MPATLAPLSAMVTAAARPIPRAAPVTTATFPTSKLPSRVVPVAGLFEDGVFAFWDAGGLAMLMTNGRDICHVNPKRSCKRAKLERCSQSQK
jgi:hypothetical protein